MSLKNIWNSLCGRPVEVDAAARNQSQTEQPQPARPTGLPEPSKTSRPNVVATRGMTTPVSKIEAMPVAKIEPPRRGVLSMLSRSEHDGLLKLIAAAQPSSVLEIGVGDGSRMPAILTMLTQSGVQPGNLKVIVIDEFELGGSELTMRDYHRQLAGLAIRPVIIPEPIGRGLVNVAHRFGMIDVVLIDSQAGESATEELATYLGKVTHQGSVILRQENGKWSSSKNSESRVRRAA